MCDLTPPAWGHLPCTSHGRARAFSPAVTDHSSACPDFQIPCTHTSHTHSYTHTCTLDSCMDTTHMFIPYTLIYIHSQTIKLIHSPTYIVIYIHTYKHCHTLTQIDLNLLSHYTSIYTVPLSYPHIHSHRYLHTQSQIFTLADILSPNTHIHLINTRSYTTHTLQYSQTSYTFILILTQAFTHP